MRLALSPRLHFLFNSSYVRCKETRLRLLDPVNFAIRSRNLVPNRSAISTTQELSCALPEKYVPRYTKAHARTSHFYSRSPSAFGSSSYRFIHNTPSTALGWTCITHGFQATASEDDVVVGTSETTARRAAIHVRSRFEQGAEESAHRQVNVGARYCRSCEVERTYFTSLTLFVYLR